MIQWNQQIILKTSKLSYWNYGLSNSGIISKNNVRRLVNRFHARSINKDKKTLAAAHQIVKIRNCSSANQSWIG